MGIQVRSSSILEFFKDRVFEVEKGFWVRLWFRVRKDVTIRMLFKNSLYVMKKTKH